MSLSLIDVFRASGTRWMGSRESRDRSGWTAQRFAVESTVSSSAAVTIVTVDVRRYLARGTERCMTSDVGSRSSMVVVVRRGWVRWENRSISDNRFSLRLRGKQRMGGGEKPGDKLGRSWATWGLGYGLWAGRAGSLKGSLEFRRGRVIPGLLLGGCWVAAGMPIGPANFPAMPSRYAPSLCPSLKLYRSSPYNSTNRPWI